MVHSALAYYALDTIKDPLKRAMRAGWLLNDDKFLYPDPDVLISLTVANGLCRYDDADSFILRLYLLWARSSLIDHMENTE